MSYVEASWAYVGPSLASWVQVGGSWTHLGSKLEVCAAILRPCRGIMVVSGVQVGGQKFEDRVPRGSWAGFGSLLSASPCRGYQAVRTKALIPDIRS